MQSEPESVAFREECVAKALAEFAARDFEIEQFRKAVFSFFVDHPGLNRGPLPILHSLKSRKKDPGHLREKILRKWDAADPISDVNLLDRVTDLAGVRVLHLHQRQFSEIHAAIMRHVTEGDWKLREDPVANSWDPEAKEYFAQFGLKVEVRETYYTSVHYLVRPPREGSRVCCEVQVRTLFEEAWGEIDHAINYPQPTENIGCREQLRVLAKLVSTGSRLADAIFRTHEDRSTPAG
jgi:putative GTP pyrophosphokinase